MILGKATSLIALSLLTSSAFAQTQTTGRIAGTVKDQNGALIPGAEVKVVSDATADKRKATTDAEGNYSVSLLFPGRYQVIVSARGFATVSLRAVVGITETTQLDVTLPVAAMMVEPDFTFIADPLIQTDGPHLGRVVDSRAASELPLASRNFTQLLGLSTGTATALADNTIIGRNTQNVSVNGARFTQNNFQINGIDANPGISGRGRLADPAPESIAEFKVQTSLYDATFGRAGGGNIQIVTKSGTKNFHGALYEYFSNDALNANNPFLKAAGAHRPVLKRNYFGVTVGGPVRRDKIFFFASYQGIRENNGVSNSISSNVLITGRPIGTRDAFARPVVLPGQLIPSSNGIATAGAPGTDLGNVGRNVLRGPKQTNIDFSVIKRFLINESKNLEFRAEVFNLFNHVNFANPISNFNAVTSSGGSIDPNTGQIIPNGAGDFGRIISTSNNPRIIQFALKLNF